ncbi:MAG: hypothetical protein ACYC1D_10155 [Acidimicrobiales bacterium]
MAQARAADPKTLLFVGLTTEVRGQHITAETLLGAYRSTRSDVSGYWLNLPGGTAKGPQGADVAVAFLTALAPSLGLTS